MTIASYPQYLRLVPKKPLACVEVGPFVPGPIVHTVRPPVPHTGRPASGPVPRQSRLSGWSHATFFLPPLAAVSRYRIIAPTPTPPSSARIRSGPHGSAQHLPRVRSTRSRLPANPPGRAVVAVFDRVCFGAVTVAGVIRPPGFRRAPSTGVRGWFRAAGYSWSLLQ